MPGTQSGFANLQRSFKQTSCFNRLFLREIQHCEVVQASSCTNVVDAQSRFANAQRFAIQKLSLSQLAACVNCPGQTVQTCCHVWMVLAQVLLVDRQRPLAELL